MSDTLKTIIGIIVAMVIMFIFPQIEYAQKLDNIAQTTVHMAVSSFVENVTKKGKITQFDYNEMVQKIYSTGNSYDIQIEAQILDDNPSRKTTTANNNLLGESKYYSIYTNTILDTINDSEKNNKFDLKSDDYITVTVKNTSETLATQLKNIFYRMTGNDTYIIGTTVSSVVLNGVTGDIESKSQMSDVEPLNPPQVDDVPSRYRVDYYNGMLKIGSEFLTHDVVQALTKINDFKRNDSRISALQSEGWTFNGWTKTYGSLIRDYEDGQNVLNLSPNYESIINLYAVWVRPARFYSGKNKEEVKETSQYMNILSYNVTIPEPPKEIGDGWKPEGWRTDDKATEVEYSITGTITDNVGPDFYAVYTREATFNSGINKSTSKTSTQYYNTNDNYAVKIPEGTETIEGWILDGWRDDTEATEKKYAPTGTITEDAGPIFNAVYTRKLTLEYNKNANDVTGTMASDIKQQYYNSNGGNPSTVTFTIKENEYWRPCYRFGIWLDGTRTYDANKTVAVGSNIIFNPAIKSSDTTRILYAYWRETGNVPAKYVREGKVFTSNVAGENAIGTMKDYSNEVFKPSTK